MQRTVCKSVIAGNIRHDARFPWEVGWTPTTATTCSSAPPALPRAAIGAVRKTGRIRERQRNANAIRLLASTNGTCPSASTSAAAGWDRDVRLTAGGLTAAQCPDRETCRARTPSSAVMTNAQRGIRRRIERPDLPGFTMGATRFLRVRRRLGALATTDQPAANVAPKAPPPTGTLLKYPLAIDTPPKGPPTAHVLPKGYLAAHAPAAAHVPAAVHAPAAVHVSAAAQEHPNSAPALLHAPLVLSADRRAEPGTRTQRQTVSSRAADRQISCAALSSLLASSQFLLLVLEPLALSLPRNATPPKSQPRSRRTHKRKSSPRVLSTPPNWEQRSYRHRPRVRSGSRAPCPTCIRPTPHGPTSHTPAERCASTRAGQRASPWYTYALPGEPTWTPRACPHLPTRTTLPPRVRPNGLS